MFNASNSLSLIRAPLAFLFLQDNVTVRIVAIILAMITDSVDGYIARKNRSTSTFGAILDPAMDKFFVGFALIVLLLEHKLALWQVLAMLSRDFFLCLYGLIMVMFGKARQILFGSIRWGKATTALQFVVLIGVVLGYVFPWVVYAVFLIMGGLAFIELFQRKAPAA